MMDNDNWKHRAKNMRCRTCMWFVPKADSRLGRCRRHAPGQGGGPGWPPVFDGDFCGDHRLDEASVVPAEE